MSKANARTAVQALLSELQVAPAHYTLGRDRIEIVAGGAVRSLPLTYPAAELGGESRVVAAVRTAVLEGRAL